MSDQNKSTDLRFAEPGVIMPQLTKRELFAAMAMQGFCANPAVFAPNPMNGWSLVNCDEEQLARYSLKIADAHLTALKETP